MHTSVLQHEYVWVYIFCLKSRRSDCPLPGRCNTPSVVYRATVRRHDNCAIDSYTGLYTGLTGGKFKDRFNQHQSDFRNKKRTASKLANHICKLQDQGTEYDISWDVVTRAPPFNPTTRMCRLCISEAYHIIFTPGGANLNKRDELFGFCKHKWKDLLAKQKT